ncbi:unnamed protein product [Ranitomeya imitator]|uniref:Reverse transcriptase domain-containing protein n=1 Tax=Ranitomeya imitator TaxID=111125 RepID=A0ABN9LEQ2_9NEOB|nr:unnamed protein product [Ranitomeya imitator]
MLPLAPASHQPVLRPVPPITDTKHRRAISDNAEKIKAIDLQLSTTGTPEELSTLKTEIQDRIARHKKDIEARKRNKFARDAEDYKSNKVYRWQDNSRRMNTRPNQHTSSDLSTSGSDHEAGSSTTVSTLPFLGQRRYPTRRRDGDRNIRRNQDNYRTTQSKRFFRSIRLKAHFATIPPTIDRTLGNSNPKLLSSASLGLRNKSNYRPPQSYHAVETFIRFVKDSFISLKDDMGRGNLFYPPNLTVEERHSLKNLQEDRTIIIKPADKGGALVVMDKSKYIAEIKRQLDDDSIYQPLDRDPLPGIRQEIKTILHLNTDRGVLDQKTCDFLLNSNPITPVFYTLPKVHKNLENPPGRPIVASTDSILSPMARYIERILTPLIKRSKSFLLDTGSFLHLIREIKTIPTDAFLLTLDVRGLYTSIPHEEGIQSIRHLLESNGGDVDHTSLCIDLLRIILTSNYFLFQDTFYLQKRGTAKGSHAAPPYANLYMVDFEESRIYPRPLFRDNVSVWRRYIDDVFCIWQGSEESLHTFLSFLNTSWPGITFTMSYDLWRINFLDTMVVKDSSSLLSTDLYSKSMDRNSLLHFNSLHSPSTKRSIPNAKYQRVEHIVSNLDTRKLRTQEMTLKFRARGYPLPLLEQSRTTTSRPKIDTNSRIPFVHSFHPFMYRLHRTIRSNWSILTNAYPNEYFGHSTSACGTLFRTVERTAIYFRPGRDSPRHFRSRRSYQNALVELK